MIKKIVTFLLYIIIICIAVFFLYCNNIKLADTTTAAFYNELKDTLTKRGLSTNLLLISTKRFKRHNYFQVRFSGAAENSRHINGGAIDFIVFDINGDNSSNSKDVDVVYDILDNQIIKQKGGIGTYKKEKFFINKQMIHIDSRGYRARWTR